MASLRTPLCELLGCEAPILLAGMGGVARWELAAAVANAGGFAMLGMVRESPDLIETEVRALRAATNRPFAVNVIPSATDPALLDRQIRRCLDLGRTALRHIRSQPLWPALGHGAAGHAGRLASADRDERLR